MTGDGEVDVSDLAAVLEDYGKDSDAPDCNPMADLNGDGRVDLLDLVQLARRIR